MSAKADVQIARIMNGLGCSKEEAEEIYKTDLEIDRGQAHDFDLSPDKEKWAKKMCNVTTRARKAPTVYQFSQRARKPNATKGGIIAELAKFLTEASDYEVANLNITNAERQIAFSIGENDFELTLVQKRKPKK